MLRTFFRRLFARGGASLLAPGDAAPAFSCPDHEGNLVTSEGLRGTRFVLWFYPKAATPG